MTVPLGRSKEKDPNTFFYAVKSKISDKLTSDQVYDNVAY